KRYLKNRHHYLLKTLKFKDPRIKESLLYKKLRDDKVQCQTCNRFCVIQKNEIGFCSTRKNFDGQLYTLQYGDVSSYSLNPIEKKPAYHYFPGSTALTLGSWGCNFTCDWCQNFHITKRPPPENHKDSSLITVEKVLENAAFNPSINGVCFSFNEPTLSLEFSIDVFKQLSDDYYKHYVTNGYMTTEALDLLITAGMNGMTVSFKGTENVVDCLLDIKLEKVWENLQVAYQRGVHIELVYLLIPTVNDDEEFILDFSQKIAKTLSVDIPVHFTRYFPAHLYKIEKTPISIMQKAHTLAKKEGLNYVYLGNIPGHPFQSTYCPECSELLIKRDSFSVTFTDLTPDNRCPKCNKTIPIFPYRPIYLNQ
ncbi:MAG: AmmeMemoRadiSam system radical SAM enzyme, partial [Candidatus Heimdallarchaeota archaeon]|nr:AmmeMemoRadiSam system radical SAM enzyme [Candidatus Heimdallarchaeota archaeon]